MTPARAHKLTKMFFLAQSQKDSRSQYCQESIKGPKGQFHSEEASYLNEVEQVPAGFDRPTNCVWKNGTSIKTVMDNLSLFFWR